MEDTALVAALFRAANRVQNVSLVERRSLLTRAAEAIIRLQMRAAHIDPRIDGVTDILSQIQRLTHAIASVDNVKQASTFLACAEVIRSLRIFVKADDL